MYGQCVENVYSNKLLGITINHNLSWEEYIKSITKRISSKLELLRDAKSIYLLNYAKDFQMPIYFHTWTTLLQYGITHLTSIVFYLLRSELFEPFWM